MSFWQWLWSQIQIHHEVLFGLAAIGFMSFAATIPEQLPFKPQDLWSWFRAFILEFMSLRSGKLVSGPPPKAAVQVPDPIDSPAPKPATDTPVPPKE